MPFLFLAFFFGGGIPLASLFDSLEQRGEKELIPTSEMQSLSCNSLFGIGVSSTSKHSSRSCGIGVSSASKNSSCNTAASFGIGVSSASKNSSCNTADTSSCNVLLSCSDSKTTSLTSVVKNSSTTALSSLEVA